MLSCCCKPFVIYMNKFLITLKDLRIPERKYFILRNYLTFFKIKTNIILIYACLYALFECTNM